MSVNQTLDIAAQTVAILVGLSVLIGGMIVALKRWIKRTVGEPLMEQVQPNGGRKETTRHLIEELVDKTDQIIARVEEIETAREDDARQVQQALSQAQSALTIATHTGERLDKMLERRNQDG